MCDGFLTTKMYFHAHEEIKEEKYCSVRLSLSVAVLSIDIESHERQKKTKEKITSQELMT